MSSEASSTESLLAALNPDRQIVGFNGLREHDLRSLLRWCNHPGEQRRVWLVAGGPGCGKTRLLIEATKRLTEDGWICGWVRPGQGTAAVQLAAQWKRRVLLVIDDADTRIEDLAATINALVRDDSDDLRLVVVAREFGGWWAQFEANLDQYVMLAVPAVPQTSLGNLTPTAHDQGQLFDQAVRHFARQRHVIPPEVSFVAVHPSPSILLIHAAAAVAVWENLTGLVDVDTAARRLFEAEESWWQKTATEDDIAALGVSTLRGAFVAAVLVGAKDLDAAVRMLRHIPGLASADGDLLHRLARWLRRYPQTTGDWLNPHLPARLTERYIADQLASNPPLLAAIAAASRVA